MGKDFSYLVVREDFAIPSWNSSKYDQMLDQFLYISEGRNSWVGPTSNETDDYILFTRQDLINFMKELLDNPNKFTSGSLYTDLEITFMIVGRLLDYMRDSDRVIIHYM
jgi:hypothetical protein